MTALRTILYFSIFDYPLTSDEIFTFSSASDKLKIDQELNRLLNNGIIYQFGEYFTDQNKSELIKRRLIGNKMAQAVMPKAIRMAKFISKFPYIETVCFSGALSKNYHDDDGDIDYFIITKPHRLWIARTLLILYKKLFLLNSRKYFCVNYFISSSNLCIKEQNRFTATELVTLIPVSGEDTYQQFIAENAWVSDYVPNKSPSKDVLFKKINKPWLSKFIQFILNSSIGDTLDNLFNKFTLNRWKSKFDDLDKKDFKIAMKSTKDVSKHHPRNFQKIVISSLNERFEAMNANFNLNLIKEDA